jgi:hypothetical protein
MTATTALAMSLAAPVGLAKGGIATGPTIAMIGEGRYDETVLPLSKRILSPIFAEAMGENNNGNTVTASLNMYGDINNAADLEDMYEDFSRLLGADLRG